MLDRNRPSTLFGYAKHRREQNNKDKSLWQCPICKNRYKSPRTHVYIVHLMRKNEYEEKYGPFPQY